MTVDQGLLTDSIWVEWVARPESSKGVENRSHALPFGPGRATQDIFSVKN